MSLPVSLRDVVTAIERSGEDGRCYLHKRTGDIERAWIGVLSRHGAGDLLPLRGIAEYRAQDTLPGYPYVNGHALDELVDLDAPVVLGSPLWVEAA